MLAVSLRLAAGAGRPRPSATCSRAQRSPAPLLHRTRPTVYLESVRTSTAAFVKMSLLFQLAFGQDDPNPDFQKIVMRVLCGAWDFADYKWAPERRSS
jgi:hypothetical protein